MIFNSTIRAARAQGDILPIQSDTGRLQGDTDDAQGDTAMAQGDIVCLKATRRRARRQILSLGPCNTWSKSNIGEPIS